MITPIIEEWRDVPNYEGRYAVSNRGRIYCSPRNIITYGAIMKNGYMAIQLSKGTIASRKWWYIHRLVAMAFLPNPDKLPFINHKDEDRTNNCVINIEWCTVSYNNKYGSRPAKFVEKRGKKVLQLDLNGRLLNEYKSIREAARETGIERTGIGGCCNHRKRYLTAGGFKWEFKEAK